MENLELEAREDGIARREFIKVSAGAGVDDGARSSRNIGGKPNRAARFD